MSAFEVDTTHIDALLTAGLHRLRGRDDHLTWFIADRGEDAYQAGEPWGLGFLEWLKTHRRELTTDTADRVGAMLMAENRRSVDHRYDEAELEQFYTFTPLPGTPKPATVINALRCYEYQSCEHPGWKDSEARQFCDALMARMVRELTKHDATWEITDRRVFLVA